jgi:hypothetical protein
MSAGAPEQPNPYAVELALAAALAEISNAQDTAITQAWAAAWSEVSADLLDTLTLILTEVGRVNASAVVRYERFARVLGAIADHLDDLATGLGVTVTNDLTDVLDQAQRGTVELIAAQRLTGGVPDRTVPSPALQAIVRRTTEQVTSLAQPIADETYATILRELTRGVAAGDNPRLTATRMVDRAEDLHNFGRSRALNVARTETVDAYREGARVTQDAHADLLAGWAWIAHLGPRTCRSCLAMHGQVFDLDIHGPDDHQQGRCSRMPVVREEDGSVDLSWLPSAKDHFERLPEADQRAILGRKGYDAWAAGDFPIEDWAREKENPGWRRSIVPATPGDGEPPAGDDSTATGGDGPEPPVAFLDRIDIVDEEIREPVELAGKAIGRVHLVPANLRRVQAETMPRDMQAQTGAFGAYHQLPGPSNPPYLWIRPPADHPDRPETAVHELGHALDDLLFGLGDSNATSGSRVAVGAGEILRPWWDAVEASQAYQAFADMAGWDKLTQGGWIRFLSTNGEIKTWSPSDRDLEYLMKPHELFARSYAQWITTRSGVAQLVVKVERRIRQLDVPPDWVAYPADRYPFYPVNWKHDDFLPIAQAFDDLFAGLGLLIQEKA